VHTSRTTAKADTFYWSACTKPGKWVVMYLCVRGFDFASFYDFSIGFLNCSHSVVFFSFYYNIFSVITIKELLVCYSR